MEGHVYDQKKHKSVEEAAFNLHEDCPGSEGDSGCPNGHMAQHPEGSPTLICSCYFLYQKYGTKLLLIKKGASFNLFLLVRRQKVLD